MISYESELWKQGIELIGGIDEAGRGPLCGSVVAACVILPKGLIIEGVNDSKKLSEKKREKLFDIINECAVSVGIGIVDEKIIDEINIKQASRLAMKNAILNMSTKPQYLLIDAESIDIDLPQKSIIKGDELSQSIAAASIIAKVTRDRMCIEWDSLYPQYKILKHKGYGTKVHIDAIKEFGPCKIHRKTFIKKFI